MNKKVCSKCKDEKHVEEFAIRKKTKTGRASACKECIRKHHVTYYKNNVEKHRIKNRKVREKFKQWYFELMATCSCKYCGDNHPSCLDHHHRNPKDKEYEVSKMIGGLYPKELILKEIAKCDVLCASCHRKFHWCERNGVDIYTVLWRNGSAHDSDS